MSCWAVIVAAGRGARSGLTQNKVFFPIRGRSVLARCLDAFRDSWRIAECGKEIPAALKEAAKGCCRVRDGYTLLVRKEDAGAVETREASLEEIMIHLEKEGEEA